MLPTYSWLKAEIVDHLRRPDLAENPDIFILLAETRINNDSNLVCHELKNEVSARATYVQVNAPVIAQPDDMARLAGIFFVDATGRKVKLQPNANDEADKYTFSAPAFFELTSGGYAIYPKSFPPNTDFIIQYYRKTEPLSDTIQTSWLLSNAPDLYLYASLLAASPYIQDDSRIPIWLGAYEQARAMINAASQSRAFGERLDYSYYGGP